MSTKTALITGAHKGLGYETARLLVSEGYEVIMTARKAGAGEKAAEKLAQETKGKTYFVALDVAEDESIGAAVGEIAALVDHLDVLVNNAGVFPHPSKSPLETDRQMLIEAFMTNTAGAFLVTQALLPHLKKSTLPPARVINVSSGLGSLTHMQSVGAAYSISKAALNAVTRQWAAMLKDQGVIVNSVCPGWCRTDMGGQNAERSPAEGAAGIAWLATKAPVSASGKFWRDRQEIGW